MPNALRDAQEVADGNADDARMLTHMAGIMAQAGKVGEGVERSDRAIELEPAVRRGVFYQGAPAAETCKRPAEARGDIVPDRPSTDNASGITI